MIHRLLMLLRTIIGIMIMRINPVRVTPHHSSTNRLKGNRRSRRHRFGLKLNRNQNR